MKKKAAIGEKAKAAKQTPEFKPMKWREAVEFLIRLVAIEDPEKLRPGDLLNLIDDFRRYLEIEGVGRPARELTEAEAKPAKLKGVIEVVRKLVNAAAAHARVEISPEGKTTIVFDGTRLGDERGAVLKDGSLRDVMAEMAASDLEDAEPWQVCRCKETGCGRETGGPKLFLAARKGQVYCSHSCANAAASREYRAGHASERAGRERSRYQRKKLAGAEAPKEQ